MKLRVSLYLNDQKLVPVDDPMFSGCFTNSEGKIVWISTSIWNAMIRVIWSLGLAVLIFLCDLGYGYLINWLLCGKALAFIGKCSFGMYLWHLNLINILESTRKHFPLNDGYFFFWNFMRKIVQKTKNLKSDSKFL